MANSDVLLKNFERLGWNLDGSLDDLLELKSSSHQSTTVIRIANRGDKYKVGCIVYDQHGNELIKTGYVSTLANVISYLRDKLLPQTEDLAARAFHSPRITIPSMYKDYYSKNGVYISIQSHVEASNYLILAPEENVNLWKSHDFWDDILAQFLPRLPRIKALTRSDGTQSIKLSPYDAEHLKLEKSSKPIVKRALDSFLIWNEKDLNHFIEHNGGKSAEAASELGL